MKREIQSTEKIMGRTIHLCTYLFIFLAVASVVRSDDECVYTVYIRTGSTIKGGTDSKMTLTLYAADGYGVRINNLETWGGLMGPDHDYFERGNLDIFSGKGPCLSGPPCLMNITSDGSGSGHGWYCNYVEVTTTGAHIPCAQQLFTVEQWIALDRSPYELTAIRDLCSGSNGVRILLKGSGSIYVPNMSAQKLNRVRQADPNTTPNPKLPSLYVREGAAAAV